MAQSDNANQGLDRRVAWPAPPPRQEHTLMRLKFHGLVVETKVRLLGLNSKKRVAYLSEIQTLKKE